jgi:hypothetical protein
VGLRRFGVDFNGVFERADGEIEFALGLLGDAKVDEGADPFRIGFLGGGEIGDGHVHLAQLQLRDAHIVEDADVGAVEFERLLVGFDGVLRVTVRLQR